jgi:hypothetical protein
MVYGATFLIEGNPHVSKKYHMQGFPLSEDKSMVLKIGPNRLIQSQTDALSGSVL